MLKTGLPLIPLGLTAAASTTDEAIHQKVFGTCPSDLASHTTLLISNEEINGIMKIIKSLEEFGLLVKGVTETITNEVKGQKGGFLSMLLGTLGASLWENVSTNKGMIATSQGRGTIRAGKGKIRAGEDTIRAGQDF